MKNKVKKGMKLINNDSKMKDVTNEIDGISFGFDDKDLQKEYVKVLKKYKAYEFNFRTSNVGHIYAKSVISGKTNEQLVKIQNYYDKTSGNKKGNLDDANYTLGSKHKFEMFEKVKDDNDSDIYRQTNKLVDFFELVDKETKKFNDIHKDSKYNDGKTRRYNIVWYADSEIGGGVSV